MTPELRASGADRAVAAWSALVAILLLIPLRLPPSLSEGGLLALDQLGHFLLFLVLALLASHSARPRTRHPWLYAAGASFLYGALLEVIQGLIGVRQAQVGDLIADGIGSVAGVLIPMLRLRP